MKGLNKCLHNAVVTHVSAARSQARRDGIDKHSMLRSRPRVDIRKACLASGARARDPLGSCSHRVWQGQRQATGRHSANTSPACPRPPRERESSRTTAAKHSTNGAGTHPFQRMLPLQCPGRSRRPATHRSAHAERHARRITASWADGSKAGRLARPISLRGATQDCIPELRRWADRGPGDGVWGNRNCAHLILCAIGDAHAATLEIRSHEAMA